MVQVAAGVFAFLFLAGLGITLVGGLLFGVASIFRSSDRSLTHSSIRLRPPGFTNSPRNWTLNVQDQAARWHDEREKWTADQSELEQKRARKARATRIINGSIFAAAVVLIAGLLMFSRGNVVSTQATVTKPFQVRLESVSTGPVASSRPNDSARSAECVTCAQTTTGPPAERDESQPGERHQSPQASTDPITQEHDDRAAVGRQTDSYIVQIAAFAADTAHPYFGVVRGKMADLLRGGQATTLQQAYDLAVAQDYDVQTMRYVHSMTPGQPPLPAAPAAAGSR